VVKVFIEIFLEYCVPVTFYETNGNYIVWVRYAEWLLTCPVSSHTNLQQHAACSKPVMTAAADAAIILACLCCTCTGAFVSVRGFPGFAITPAAAVAFVFAAKVILIHLSNLTGLADDYNKRTMSLLVSDIGTIVMGITAAIASGYVKVGSGMLM
jgi:bacteriorhodopsin